MKSIASEARELSSSTTAPSISLSDTEIRLAPLSGASSIPFVISPATPGVDLADWAASHGEQVSSLWLQHRALLFRGFQVGSVEKFHAFVRATSSGPLLEYKDRSTPRYELGQGVYVSTIYPPDQRIHPHNEGTYWKTWPLKIYFCSLQVPKEGGETPFVDVRKVYDRIDPAIRELFREKQVMYVRNYNPGIGLTWKDAFQTTDPRVVEEYAKENAIHIEWTSSGLLRTRQIRPAIRQHPLTGESVWFNHGAFFHVTSLDPEVQDALLSSYGEEGLPYNTYFGDGSPIDPAMVAHIREAYAAEKVLFPWRPDDVALLDNMCIAHAREPYVGDRKVIVAMTEAQSGAAS